MSAQDCSHAAACYDPSSYAMASLGDSLALLFSELTNGPKGACYILNTGDQGLLRALDPLSAAAASTVPRQGGASIAAHVDHVLYGLNLMNRWVAGEEDPFTGADWAASWTRSSVSTEEWAALRDQFRIEAHRGGGRGLRSSIGACLHLARNVSNSTQRGRRCRLR